MERDGEKGNHSHLTRLLAKLLLEVVKEIRVDLAADLISGLGIGDALNHATLN